ncbi:Hypothetical protein FKW44_003798, partial [Caligus rogercresseyi]
MGNYNYKLQIYLQTLLLTAAHTLLKACFGLHSGPPIDCSNNPTHFGRHQVPSTFIALFLSQQRSVFSPLSFLCQLGSRSHKKESQGCSNPLFIAAGVLIESSESSKPRRKASAIISSPKIHSQKRALHSASEEEIRHGMDRKSKARMLSSAKSKALRLQESQT